MSNDFLSIIHPKPREEREATREAATEKRVYPVLPVRDTVLFPHAVLPLTVGRGEFYPVDQLARRREDHHRRCTA